MQTRINKWLDFLDRVAWTFIAVFPATLSADAIFNAELSWAAKFGIPVLSALFTAVKVVTAQNSGGDNLGSAVPGKVIES